MPVIEDLVGRQDAQRIIAGCKVYWAEGKKRQQNFVALGQPCEL
jgi:hypothetical protein